MAYELLCGSSSIIAKKTPGPASLKNLEKENLHPAIKRNSLRALQFIDVPEKYQGILMNYCFDYATCPTEAIAVKALSLTLLEKFQRFTRKYYQNCNSLLKTTPSIRPPLLKVVQEKIMRTIHASRVK